jgi:hypothetical protein
VRRIDHPTHRVRVNRAVRLVAKAGLPVDRRNVIHDLDPFGRTPQRIGIADVALGYFESNGIGERTTLAAHEHSNVVTRRRQIPGEVSAGEPGRTGD